MPTPATPDPIESALQSLTPAKSQLDRDAVLYAAAYAAGHADAARRPTLRVWRAATCVATAACVLLLIGRRDDPQEVEEPTAPIVAASEQQPTFERPGWKLDGPLAIRPAAVVTLDVPDTPSTNNAPAASPRSAGRMLDELLDELSSGLNQGSEA